MTRFSGVVVRVCDLYSGLGHKVFTASGREIYFMSLSAGHLCFYPHTAEKSKQLRKLVSGPLADMGFSFYCLK